MRCEKVYDTKCEINDNNLKGVGGAMCIVMCSGKYDEGKRR